MIDCLMVNKWYTSFVTYKVKLPLKMKKTNYIGLTQGKCKERFTQHKNSLKNKSKRNATSLSTQAWDKQINTLTEIKCNIIKKCSVYKPGNSYCDLCLSDNFV